MKRRLKSPQELINEGYNAEGALVFLKDFIQEEKDKVLNELMTCPPYKLPEKRATYKYICSLEDKLLSKIETGINHATEQFRKETQWED